ncbi:MAG: hypothetical protein US13_C0005G0015 [candidate division TM6 bacterium GW2011_GWE2_36_25]|nr:MAG: hypothetical protein US03_C0005G0030 [candidate division TM6 bacterium GW2011_GWF2_36_131]KKQ03131.1 MAG: hypothetical protein US13_C0005G0015 [candidate division TM6 bacterium GW2011_GWE2_36_25]KKQ19381.1 MAG: hypothetical protein US32_C0010G0030 [candidate division TM6 bacterium GW2011_GWA2_36_9]
MKYIIVLSLILFASNAMELKTRLKKPASKPDWCTLCYKVDLNQCDEKDISTKNCGHRFCKKCLDYYQSRGPKTCPFCGAYEDRCDMWCDITLGIGVCMGLCCTIINHMFKPLYNE